MDNPDIEDKKLDDIIDQVSKKITNDLIEKVKKDLLVAPKLKVEDTSEQQLLQTKSLKTQELQEVQRLEIEETPEQMLLEAESVTTQPQSLVQFQEQSQAGGGEELDEIQTFESEFEMTGGNTDPTDLDNEQVLEFPEEFE